MERTYERIASELLGEIVSGRRAAGTWLPAVSEIAARFACSPATAREAIRALHERGVVAVRAGHGQQVLGVDHWDLLDRDVAGALLVAADGTRLIAQAAEARRVLETHAAMLAARQLRPRDLDLLEHEVERMRAAANAGVGDSDRFADAEAAFHRTLMVLSGNRYIAAMLAPLHPVLAAARRRRAPDRDAVAVRLIERIVAALAAQDATATAAAVDEYGRRLTGWIRS
jgi:DNA-binding FadR family transcriptional regulator